MTALASRLMYMLANEGRFYLSLGCPSCGTMDGVHLARCALPMHNVLLLTDTERKMWLNAQARIDALEKALRPFAEFYDGHKKEWKGKSKKPLRIVETKHGVTVRRVDFRRAYDALKK